MMNYGMKLDTWRAEAHTAGITALPAEQWLAIARNFCDFSYQQHPAYAALRVEQHGGSAECIVIRLGDEVIGAAVVRLRTLPLIGGVAYIAGGPLVRRNDADDAARLAQCLHALREEYVRKRGLTLRILGAVGNHAWLERSRDAFATAKLQPTDRSRSYRTLLLDLTPPLDALLAQCSKYWRRNLRRAERNDALRIRSGSHEELFQIVRTLHERLRTRKTFAIDLDASFYTALQSRLDTGSELIASVVEHEGEAVSGLIHSLLGDTAVPLILASSDAGLKHYAAYQLQWHSIALAKYQGLRYYDLGGIDPMGNPGVYNFKIGLRGADVAAPGPFEAIAPGMRGVMLRGAEDMYRSMFAPAFNTLRRRAA